MNIEPPKASPPKIKRAGPKTVFQYTHSYFWFSRQENGPRFETAPFSGVFDASAPCSWNLTLTVNADTNGGDSTP
ncbi:MAG: hypothetical protein NWE96_04165 [Candidatus Bathyarchaeota archaeon]|nr:hypothetical protein [Candidatus Bathyarchaeota archaeon]